MEVFTQMVKLGRSRESQEAIIRRADRQHAFKLKSSIGEACSVSLKEDASLSCR